MFTSDHRPVVVLSGRDNPAAFMPSELLSNLIHFAYDQRPAARDAYRRGVEASAVALGFGANLWRQLEPIARAMRESANKAAAGVPGSAAESVEASRAACRATSDALRGAYARFGEQQFLRLLYQAVAPDLGQTTAPADAKQLRFVEEGCR